MKRGQHPAARPGTSPAARRTALLVIDMISTWAIADGAALRTQARRMLSPLRRLLARARAHGVPVIYANDNFGAWRADFAAVLALVRAHDPIAAAIANAIAPTADDYIVLKPKHSAFFCTPLPQLLDALGVRRLVLTGASGDQCVQATAADALLREFEVTVPRDTIACPTAARTRAVLRHFGVAMDIPTPAAARVRW